MEQNVSDNEVKAWAKGLYEKHGPKVGGYKQCIKDLSFYKADTHLLPMKGALRECGMQDCAKWVKRNQSSQTWPHMSHVP